MKEEITAAACEQQNELIAFLYGELDQVGAERFKSHMLQCAQCHMEVSELKGVRQSVVSWRNESLGGLTSAAALSGYTTPVISRKSAIAAVRQFFDLSPLWLKGAVACASILFCLFASLAIARLRQNQSVAIATNNGSREYSERELKAMVDSRVQAELQNIKDASAQTSTAAVHDVVIKNTSMPNRNRAGNRSSEVADNVPSQKARRPLTKTEREELAADLRLVATPGEADLLDDRANQ